MLSIKIRPGERFQISHQGVQAWVTVEKDGSHIRVLVDGPRSMKVLRENLCEPPPAGNAAPPISVTLPDCAGAASA